MDNKLDDAKKLTVKDKLKALEARYTEVLKQLASKSQIIEGVVETLKGCMGELGMSTEYAASESDIEEMAQYILRSITSKTKSYRSEIDTLKEERFNADSKVKALKQVVDRTKIDKSDLLAVLKHKEFELEQLKRINETLKDEENDPILKRFSSIEQSTSPPKISDAKDEEISRLKIEIDELYSKIDSLETQLTGTKKPLRFAVAVQTDPISHRPVNIESRLLESSNKEVKDEEEETSKAYLKNLIIRYMVYEAKRNETECSVIRRAILDCVGVGSEDRALIDNAITNRGGIKDAVYFLKLFGGQYN